MIIPTTARTLSPLRILCVNLLGISLLLDSLIVVLASTLLGDWFCGGGGSNIRNNGVFGVISGLWYSALLSCLFGGWGLCLRWGPG